jgi:hypothetical protein
MNPDFVSAIAAYLAQIQAAPLGVTPTNAGVWTNYGDQGTYPYAIVTNPRESYQVSSNDPQTGEPTFVIARGVIQVRYFGTAADQVRALARQCLLSLSKVAAWSQLISNEGNCLEVLLVESDEVPITDSGTQSPTVYCRQAVMQYVVEFYV